MSVDAPEAPFEHRVQTRWSDFDGLGHVNNAVVLMYLTAARDAFFARNDLGPDEYVVGRCRIDYNGEIPFGWRWVTVRSRIAAIGSKSVTTSEQIVGEDGEVVVDAEFTLVLWDSEARRSRLISDPERKWLESRMAA